MTEPAQNPDEKVLLISHKHWMALLTDMFYVALPALVALLILVLVSELPQTGIDQGIHVITAILFPGCMLAVVIMAAILWSNYYLNMLVVTDRELFVVSQSGLTKREVYGWNLHDIEGVSSRQGSFLETFFNFGVVLLSSQGEEACIGGIPDPEYVCSVILKQDDTYGELEQTTERQKELLHFLSHEVKGHLTKSKAAFAAIIEGDYGPVSQPLTSMAHTALEDSQKGVETVMSILDSANLESGEMRIAKKEFDLAACIRRLIEEFRSVAAAKGLSLVASIDATCMIEGDEQKIERHVIRNFIDNAIKYTPAGQIDITLEKVNNMARISVADTGVGINSVDMQKLFTQGGHGEHSRDVNPESTGYGLFIAKQIVEKHGGRIWARSDHPKGGSTFFAEFPLLSK